MMDLLLDIRARLFDALRDPECPDKELGPITRQLRENEKDIALLDSSIEMMRVQYDLLKHVQAILTKGVENCAYGYLAMMTRQLKLTTKEVDTLAEQLKHEGYIDGGTDTGSPEHGSWSTETL